MGNKLLIWLIVQYVIIAFAYLFNKDYAKFIYFLGAIILSIGVLMK